MRAEKLRYQPVEEMPETLEHGVLYVSEKYGTAAHLCACGCGWKTVTPLTPYWRDGWEFKLHSEGRVTLDPSIGNQQFPCRSHYWVRLGEVEWA